jgi:hypothetical protein
MEKGRKPSLTFKIIVALIAGFVFLFWVVIPWLYPVY